MSLLPKDPPVPTEESAPSAPTAAPTAAAGAALALNAAGLAGADPSLLAAAGTAMQVANALQAGNTMAAVAGGASALAAHVDPRLAQAMQLASQAQGLLAQVGAPAALQALPADMPEEVAAEVAEAVKIAEHPLAGQAVNDFVTPESPFVPAAIDPENQDTPAELLAALGFTEGTRLLRLYAPVPGLLIESLSGSAGISQQFSYHLTLLSTDAAIPLKSMMGMNVSVGVQLADTSEHFINGYVNSFGFSHSDGGFAFYHAEIVPWLTYLKRRVNSRIFQQQTVLEVLDKVFSGDHGGMAKFEFRTSRTYPTENYVVQYDETDEHFTCRLMEKYGLFYYFEHSASGHVMVISDDSCNATFCPPQKHHANIEFNGGNRWQDTDCVSALSAERLLQSTKIALNTFDFKDPNTVQLVELPTVAEQGEVPRMEIYDGNPAFSYKDKDAGRDMARQRMEVLEWQAKVFSGASDCRGLVPGHTFKLLDHHWFAEDGADNELLVLSVQYSARNNYFAQGTADVYHNTFTAIRRKIPYRPRQAHRAPRMPGPQTATVVGPKGTEIHTDEFGRIKVQFHWDRYGRRDELSSCWIRVSQSWAGQGWGTISVPRVGQEVIIDYLEGDPDRPVCTGRLFNADQPVPYGLPAAAHMMGFKSRSTPGGGGFCEMVIHDQKGKELINIHSQKDMVTTVQNTQATVVNGPHQTNTVTNGFQVTTVKKHIKTTSETAHIHDTAKTNIELTAETEHIHLKANTDITFEVGSSKIVMKTDGTITIEGVNVKVVGSSRIDLNN